MHLYFFVRGRILNKISLKSCHLIFAEQRRTRACPDKPEYISSSTLFFTVHCKKALRT